MKAKLPPDAMEVPAYSTGTPFCTLINCIFKGCWSPDTRPFTMAKPSACKLPTCKIQKRKYNNLIILITHINIIHIWTHVHYFGWNSCSIIHFWVIFQFICRNFKQIQFIIIPITGCYC